MHFGLRAALDHTHLGQSVGRASAKGPEDQFRPPGLSGRCWLGVVTFAGVGDKEEDAPIPDLCALASDRTNAQVQPKAVVGAPMKSLVFAICRRRHYFCQAFYREVAYPLAQYFLIRAMSGPHCRRWLEIEPRHDVAVPGRSASKSPFKRLKRVGQQFEESKPSVPLVSVGAIRPAGHGRFLNFDGVSLSDFRRAAQTTISYAFAFLS
jgi:hypothetical protein